MKVPFLSHAEIENAALELLHEYGQKFGVVRQPPVPADEVVESHLELDMQIIDLRSELGVPDVLGATWIKERRVAIDESLDPTVRPDIEGRYRFTVAHEIAHWLLHRHLFLLDDQPVLFGARTQPNIVCRSSAKDPMEYQADQFASVYLMPKEMVQAAWKRLHGDLTPYVADKEIANLKARGLNNSSIKVARDLSREFKVSAQAMQIRLVALGLVLEKAPLPSLF